MLIRNTQSFPFLEKENLTAASTSQNMDQYSGSVLLFSPNRDGAARARKESGLVPGMFSIKSFLLSKLHRKSIKLFVEKAGLLLIINIPSSLMKG